MASITVRALDANGDPLQGNGQNNFISDLDAVAQIIKTSLLLFQGEWFLDLLDGLPLFNGMLGASGNIRNLSIITGLIAARITSRPFVVRIVDISASFQSRRYAFRAQVETQFGTIFVSSPSATVST